MADNILPGLPDASIAITGTNRGLGRALALALGRAGASLTLHARDPDALDRVAGAARDAGALAVATVAGDLTDPTLGARLADTARDTHGTLDALILSAAMLGPMGELHELPDAAIADVMRVNVSAQVPLYREALPLLLAGRGGAVLWLSSGLGRFGLPRYGAYAASKHAVEGLMKVAAQEQGPHGLVSLTIAPGMVQTEMLRAALEGGDISPFQTPEATADAFVRLLVDLDPSHNGQSLDIEPWLRPGAPGTLTE